MSGGFLLIVIMIGNVGYIRTGVLPSRIELKAYNKSSSFAMNEILNTGNDPTSLAQFKIGQEIKLTCKAFLGTHNNGMILWRKSNIVAGSGLASYLPNTGEHEVGQLVPTACQFEKTDSITYNMTDQDSTRTTSNPLQFQCFISAPSSPVTLPETTVQNFYMKVSNVNEPNTGGLATAGSGDAGVIAGAVIGSLVGIVIIVLLVYFLWYRRRAGGDDYTTKEEQEPVTPILHQSRNTHNLPKRVTRTERWINNSTHMGVDPEHGGIGTGV